MKPWRPSHQHNCVPARRSAGVIALDSIGYFSARPKPRPFKPVDETTSGPPAFAERGKVRVAQHSGLKGSTLRYEKDLAWSGSRLLFRNAFCDAGAGGGGRASSSSPPSSSPLSQQPTFQPVTGNLFTGWTTMMIPIPPLTQNLLKKGCVKAGHVQACPLPLP